MKEVVKITHLKKRRKQRYLIVKISFLLVFVFVLAGFSLLNYFRASPLILPKPSNLKASWQEDKTIYFDWNDVLIETPSLAYDVRLQTEGAQFEFQNLVDSEFTTKNRLDLQQTKAYSLSVRTQGLGAQNSSWATIILYPKIIQYQIGQTKYTLKIAQNENERQKGLSYQQKLAADEGMLFIFDQLGDYGIWMKDMQFAIDIIWLNENFEIVGLKENIDPLSHPNIYQASEPSRYILELSAGQIEINSLRLDQKLIPPVFLSNSTLAGED